MNRPLNIAIVSAADLSGDDAHAIHVRELARALAAPDGDGRQTRQVAVYARRQDEAARSRTRLAPGATQYNLDAGPARPMADDELLPYVRDLAAELRRRWSGTAKPDLIHAHGWIGGLAACAAARDLNIPLVQSFHGLGIIERRAGRPVHPARARLERALGREANVVLAPTSEEVEGLVRLGIPRPRIGITPYGIDGEQFSQTGPALPRGDRHRLVTVAHDLNDDGVTTAIRALEHIPDAELTIVGGPHREDLENDPTVHRLRLLAKELHLADRVIFLGDMAPKALPRLLRTATLALCLSPHPSPMTPLQAMACGVPVVAVPTGNNGDAVLDGITGLHVPADQPRTIGRAIRRLLSQETTLAAYAIAAADRAHTRYSWDRVAAETARAYDKVLPRVEEPVEEPEAEVDEGELVAV